MTLASVFAPSLAAAQSQQEAGEDSSDAEPKGIGRFPDEATLVTEGEFPGSITLPGTETSVRIGGFIQTDVVYDADSLGFPDVVRPSTIPLDGSPQDGEQSSQLGARQSRINFDVRGTSSLGTVRGFVEADFLGQGNDLTTGYAFQLRHAAAQLGNVFIGQWWSSFDDVASIPEGAIAPLGAPTLRQPGIRWAQKLSGWRYGVAIEDPEADVRSPEGQVVAESVPDLSGYLQFDRKSLHLRLAGLYRQLATVSDRDSAGGFNVSGRVPLSFITDHDNVSFQAQYGAGFARYYLPLAGDGLDAAISELGSITPTRIASGYLAYQHWWSETWRSTAFASALDLDADGLAAPESLRRAQAYAVNLFWSPIQRTTFGVDFIYARRETVDGSTGDGFRVHATARVNFWPPETSR